MTIAYTDSNQEQLPAVATTVYTTPTVNSAHIIYATVFNESVLNATLTLNIVKNGGTLDETNRYVSRTIPAGASIVLNEIINRVLKGGDTIQALAGTASSLNLTIGTKEIT